MLKCPLFFIFVMFAVNTNAQQADSLFAVHNGTNWIIKYTLTAGETTQRLAKRFDVMDGTIENASSSESDKKLTTGSVINIPVAPENYLVTKPPPMDMLNIRELYYKVVPKDDIEMISMYAGITKPEMRKWNNLHGNTLVPGTVLFIGWLKMVARDTTNAECWQAYYFPRKKQVADTSKVIALGGLDTLYNKQTSNGVNVLNEKGTAVFFEKPGRNNIYYAFHNSTPRGGVIKVYNPGNGRTIYVKVLGPLPNTKLYANSIIGISNSAKEALGVTDTKAWCELTYATN